jgi:hypothetical protein
MQKESVAFAIKSTTYSLFMSQKINCGTLTCGGQATVTTVKSRDWDLSRGKTIVAVFATSPNDS